jgi:hypothetical protein
MQHEHFYLFNIGKKFVVDLSKIEVDAFARRKKKGDSSQNESPL